MVRSQYSNGTITENDHSIPMVRSQHNNGRITVYVSITLEFVEGLLLGKICDARQSLDQRWVMWSVSWQFLANTLHFTFRKCWFDANPTSQTIAQHYTNIGWLWRACRQCLLINLFIAGIVFIRQNLTSMDVRFWRIKSVQRWKRKYLS